ncbi:interferon alpha-inducible protein 27-like protein 2A [Zootoca vivipara]|uniref:interferon alpha-inducible protein 27-like protein 2A n=1 Tax=Zootoca vivipara TaxID=8524 RepID=UPI00293BB44A|nr:interferon alpha-inducible protein 27-like protein 2A [Zootoca vivipara]
MVGVPGMVLGGVAGLAVATVAVPAALGTAGFTGAGIAAGSLAAKMMSTVAVANGGGVAAGSAVDVLQSVGAAGLSAVGANELGGGGTIPQTKCRNVSSTSPRRLHDPCLLDTGHIFRYLAE